MSPTMLEKIKKSLTKGKKLYWVLLDPDDFTLRDATKIAKESESCGADAILVGGSLLYSNHFDKFIQTLKKSCTLPVMIFPGDATQLSPNADALLYLSLVSGRNPSNLIGEHVKAAPIIKQTRIEPIPTAYMLIESGAVSSVEFMSNTRPLPRNKPELAAAHALAAQYMGMGLVYLEAGSGAQLSVPPELIKAVRKWVDIPIIVGGGIRDAATAKEKIDAGADIIVTGNVLQNKNGIALMKEIAQVIKAA